MNKLFSQWLAEVNTPSAHTALTIYGYDPSSIAIEETDRTEVVNTAGQDPSLLPEKGALKTAMLNKAIADFTKLVTRGKGSPSIIRSQPVTQEWMDWAFSDANELLLWKMEGGTPALTAMVYQL